MHSLRNILVPIDFSDPAHHALLWAIELADRYQARVTLLNVYPVPGYVLPDGFVTAGPEVLNEIESKTKQSLKELAAQVQESSGIALEIATAVGQSSTEILRYADQHEVDLIAMGAHGRTGIALMLLGSTTDKVVRQARCPVIVVPAEKKA
jgi:nucleotide-binding universal stress UspA family protein